jgi:hypothetical protein
MQFGLDPSHWDEAAQRFTHAIVKAGMGCMVRSWLKRNTELANE